MATEQNLRPVTLVASTDLSAKQFYLVALGASGVALCGDGLQASGVLLNKPAAAGREAEVQPLTGGAKCRVVAGGVITAGALVASDSSGRVVTAISGDYIVGEAEEAADAAGDIITVLLHEGGKL